MDYFRVQLTHSVISDGVVNLFVHSSVCDRQKLYSENTSFGTVHYEVVSSPFILWKFYLDILARIVLNHCDKYIIPALLSGLDTDDCRKVTVHLCIVLGLKKIKLRKVFLFLALVCQKS